MRFVQPVRVKHILTEQKRQEITDKFTARRQRFRHEQEQLKFQLQKALRDAKTAGRQDELRHRYKMEIADRENRLELMDFKEEQLRTLPLGAELDMGTTDMIVDLEVGDRWIDGDKSLAVVIKDGYIHEIKETEVDDAYEEEDELV
ncbi:YlqD family protein [Shouchella lonarensis]|uniref:YlqD protein n=1 Tax=Shouchella lonarensis TaxID=1464122 RepID=A0A1G6LBF7_9BACI|nr:YlqD family protein [Shouchella lonarensis]SDC40531.1 YlqD protein [Shouchella lonarensis]